MQNEVLVQKVESIIQSSEYKKRDLRGVYADPNLMKEVSRYLAESFQGKVDYVMSPEPLGFIIGSNVARDLAVGFAPIRNGDIDYLDTPDAVRAVFINHRDQARSLMVREGAVPKGSRVLLVDDWIETAATIQACKSIVEQLECELVGVAAIGAQRNDVTNRMFEKGLVHAVIVR